MNIQRGYKVELDLNNAERSACARHAGVVRFAYNWVLRRKIEARQAGEKAPSAIDLHRELNALYVATRAGTAGVSLAERHEQ